GRQRDHLEPIGEGAYDFERLPPDGAGGAEDSEADAGHEGPPEREA
ncbi:MAG: hypothetical protein HW396_788, partial [Candidatus Dadabacteria bacterium]|nr:hypothetical protein [Candidatus Dadabacteria bacterium]